MRVWDLALRAAGLSRRQRRRVAEARRLLFALLLVISPGVVLAARFEFGTARAMAILDRVLQPILEGAALDEPDPPAGPTSPSSPSPGSVPSLDPTIEQP